ncbi:MAG: DUF1902 domain-containing protein [Rhodospirillaceae bacterium]|nr:DUF1902 domain-containing protein [Rhodospirillaceae bacterium]
MPPKGVGVQATWDDDAKVWVVESDDVPGLVAEAASLDALAPTLDALIPELLFDNRGESQVSDIQTIPNPEATT